MACWSSENAIKAFLQALKMGKTGNKEPDAAEFISALAAGNNSQLMVVASAGPAGAAVSTILPLVAAAHQTAGQVVCILPTTSKSYAPKHDLGPHADCVKFVKGEAKSLLANNYKGADFILVDCNIDDPKGVFLAAQECAKEGRGVIVGYNAFHKRAWPSDFKTKFLPIGEGLLVTKMGTTSCKGPARGNSHRNRRSKWVVTVDKCTGEEHVYRITSSQAQQETRA